MASCARIARASTRPRACVWGDAHSRPPLAHGRATRARENAPPTRVHVEYDESRHLDAFLAVADALEEAFPRVLVDGNDARALARESPREGSFEVVVCDRVDAADDGEDEALASVVGKTAAFSALAAGRPPTALEVLEAVERLATAEELGVDDGFSSTTGCG